VSCPATTAAISVVYTTVGPRTITLTVTDSLGRVATTTRTATVQGLPDSVVVVVKDTTPRVAELPRDTLRDPFPALVRSVPVPAGWNLQDAMNAAQAGDQIVLAKGASYIGNFLWTRCLAGWVTIVTGGATLAEGQRATPTIAAAQGFAKLVTPNVAPAVVAKNGACKLWLSRVEVTGTAQSATVNYNYGLVRLGEDETTIAALPSDIVLERTYIHGTPTTSVQHGVVFNARRLTLKDSWVSEIHWPGTESHCVAGWDGVGPFRISNSYLNCASINVLFGGATPKIVGAYSGDVELDRNHFTKDTLWRGKGSGVKNLLEFKNARRVLSTANVFENVWSDGQEGMAINLQSNGEYNPLTADLTFWWNDIRNVNQCFVLLAHDNLGFGVAMARVVVEQFQSTRLREARPCPGRCSPRR
jgi:hypothetical protein